MTAEQSRAAYAESVDDLARRALGALQGSEGTAVASAHVRAASDGVPPSAALGAVRFLGADVLAPYVLNNSRLPPDEADAMTLALEALPPARQQPAAPPAGTPEPWIMAWRDWATVTLLSRISDTSTSSWEVPLPDGPALCDEAVPQPSTPAPAPEDEARENWATWSVRMSQLSSLALPGLDGPVNAAARTGAKGLARGATRAVLRRDFATAARMTRWLAWLHTEQVPLPLDPVPLTEHIGLVGGGRRSALEIAIARRMLGLEAV